MKKQYLWAKIVIVAAFSAASSAAWAGNCDFTGGHYNGSPDTNTLYLESYAVEGSEVVITNNDAQCINNNRNGNGETKVVVLRDTPLKSTSTLVLPFQAKIDSMCFVAYEVKSFSKVNGKWEITASDSGGIVQKDRPYILRVKMEKSICQDVFKIPLKLESSVSQSSGSSLRANFYNNSSHNNDFYAVGTYKYIKWESGASGIDRVYGYAAKDKNGASGGQFVKIGSGAYLPPLRVYLEYQHSGLAKKSSNNGEDFELPETIEVRLIDSDSTMSIGKLNPVTGEIQMDSRRFDLNGRLINGKPANHGVYVNKKKAVR